LRREASLLYALTTLDEIAVAISLYHCTTALASPSRAPQEPLDRFAPSRALHDPLPLPCQGSRF